MKGSGRNGRCPCGSGEKVKQCCGVRRGPGVAELAKAFVAEETRKAALDLVGLNEEKLDRLLDEVVDLPALDMSLQADLPRVLTPELERLRAAIDEGEEEAFDGAVDLAVGQLDSPQRRAALAAAVVRLREHGRINRRVAAVALVDLGVRRSWLLRASVIQSLAVSTGAARTPSGLLVAAGL